MTKFTKNYKMLRLKNMQCFTCIFFRCLLRLTSVPFDKKYKIESLVIWHAISFDKTYLR